MSHVSSLTVSPAVEKSATVFPPSLADRQGHSNSSSSSSKYQVTKTGRGWNCTGSKVSNDCLKPSFTHMAIWAALCLLYTMQQSLFAEEQSCQLHGNKIQLCTTLADPDQLCLFSCGAACHSQSCRRPAACLLPRAYFVFRTQCTEGGGGGVYQEAERHEKNVAESLIQNVFISE